eukprot:1232960-Prymnesium_polylepis.1
MARSRKRGGQTRGDRREAWPAPASRCCRSCAPPSSVAARSPSRASLAPPAACAAANACPRGCAPGGASYAAHPAGPSRV